MPRRPATVSQADMERVLRAASRMNVGAPMTIRLLPDGSILAVPLDAAKPPVDASQEPEIDDGYTLY